MGRTPALFFIFAVSHVALEKSGQRSTLYSRFSRRGEREDQHHCTKTGRRQPELNSERPPEAGGSAEGPLYAVYIYGN